MESAENYLSTTEPAIQHMFMALEMYRQLTPRPSLREYKNDDGVIRLTQGQAKNYLDAEIDSMSLDIAKSTLCGAIVQVAYSGIKQFSTNTDVPRNCQEYDISPKSAKAKFCVGRKVHELPIGLIIYAARIQYNHWEDGTPSNPTAKSVFRHLLSVRLDDMWHDMVYELDWPGTRPVTHYVLELELKWNKYKDYISDMKQILK